MCEITFIKSYSGDSYFVKSVAGDLPKRLSMTKALGGKTLVSMSRYWTHHGGGGVIVEYNVRANDAETIKQSLESYGIKSIWLDNNKQQTA